MKYDDLVAEADEAGFMFSDVSCDDVNAGELFDRLAAAIRDLQQHVPPEGWRVTELTREDGARAVYKDNGSGVLPAWWSAHRSNGYPILREDGSPEQSLMRMFHTPAAAMASIEGEK